MRSGRASAKFASALPFRQFVRTERREAWFGKGSYFVPESTIGTNRFLGFPLEREIEIDFRLDSLCQCSCLGADFVGVAKESPAIWAAWEVRDDAALSEVGEFAAGENGDGRGTEGQCLVRACGASGSELNEVDLV